MVFGVVNNDVFVGEHNGTQYRPSCRRNIENSFEITSIVIFFFKFAINIPRTVVPKKKKRKNEDNSGPSFPRDNFPKATPPNAKFHGFQSSPVTQRRVTL